MTPAELQLNCTHAPYYQKGCIACNVRYVKFLRPSRAKQDAFLAGLPERERDQTIELLRKERECSSTA